MCSLINLDICGWRLLNAVQLASLLVIFCIAIQLQPTTALSNEHDGLGALTSNEIVRRPLPPKLPKMCKTSQVFSRAVMKCVPKKKTTVRHICLANIVNFEDEEYKSHRNYEYENLISNYNR